jgi:hypothetical protein
MSMKLAGAAVVLAALAVTTSVAASAATGGVSVSGTQTVLDEKQGIYAMHGALLGSWHVTSFVPRYKNAHPFVATGTEKFVGCQDVDRSTSCDVDEPTGTLRLMFVYWADYDAKTNALVRGECVHPLVGGTGAFARASGVLFMKDAVVGTTVRTTYHGELQYGSSAALRLPASAATGEGTETTAC